MSDDIRTSTCCPTDTPDSVANGGSGIFSYRVDGNEAHPDPEVTCPDNFNAWLQDGEYVVPDFSSAILIDGLCALDSEFTVTQNPTAGTVIEIGGELVVLITVTDRFGNEVVCSFTVNVRNPSAPDSSTPPTILPPWVYRPYLFAYWPINDTQCTGTPGAPPCWFRIDLSSFLGNTSPHDLLNAGDAVLAADSAVQGFSTGPIFDRGSMYSGNLAAAYLYHADDTALRLLNTDFTLRMFFKLVLLDDASTWPLVGKFSAVGYRLKIVRSGSEYRLSPELKNGSTTLTTTYRLITLNEWIYVAMVFRAASGKLSLYVDGEPVEEAVSAGFALSGEASQFRIGSNLASSSMVALAYWTLNDTTWSDSGPRSFNLTNAGGVTNVAGHIGNAMQGAGANANLFVADDPSLRLTATSFTIRAWVKFSSGSAPWQIVHKTNGTNGYRLYIEPSGLAVVLEIDNAGVVDLLFSSAGITPGAWTHIVARFNRTTREASIYMNNVLRGSATFTNTNPGDYTGQLRLGELTSAGTFLQDETGIWEEEWDAAKINTDYNGGAGSGFSPGSGAICYHDEVGIWTQAWNDARVAEDYAIMTI